MANRKDPNYSGLKNTPSLCKGLMPYYRIDPVIISIPYKNISEVSVEVLSPVYDSPAEPLFAALRKGFAEAGVGWSYTPTGALSEGGFGYHSTQERELLASVMELSREIAQNYNSYEPRVRNRIKQLNDAAYDDFLTIGERYDYYVNRKEYALKQADPRDPEFGKFPLSVLEFQMDAVVDWAKNAKVEQGTSSRPVPVSQARVTRAESREKIRELWDRGLSLLWCAQIGVAQSESYLANKAIYDESPQISGAFQTAGESAPPKPPKPPQLTPMQWAAQPKPPTPPRPFATPDASPPEEEWVDEWGEGEGAAEPTAPKKKDNTLLIAGAAIGALLIFGRK